VTQTRQQAKQPSVSQPTSSSKAGKTLPVPLSPTEIKTVAGGVGAKTLVVNLPRGTW
jgi:hypothetical protein